VRTPNSGLEQMIPHQPAQRDWSVRRVWGVVSTFATVIGLASINDGIIRWMWLIHWVITQYNIIKTNVFELLPFSVPVGWHDYIIIGGLLLSVTNVGLYWSKEKVFILFVINMIRNPDEGYEEFRPENLMTKLRSF
jgi:hypothetical protein